MENVICILAFGLSAAFFSRAVAERVKSRRLWLAGGMERGRGGSLIMAAAGGISGRLPNQIVKLFTWRRPEKIKKLVTEAGLEGVMDEKVYCAAKLLAAACGSIMFFLFVPQALPARFVLGAIAGIFFVDARLKSAARRRREEIELVLPNALDWLSLSVEAGLDFAQALGRISQKINKGPLKDELMRLDSAMRMGTPRRSALADMGRRTSSAALKSFASSLIQADALGVGIAPVLRAGAERLRGGRFLRAEKKGAAAAQKALLPLALCIMPATFIVIFGPLVARLVTGGFDSLFYR